MEGLDAPPYPGPKGQEIFETVSKQAWQEWLQHQTMMINEKRLNVMDPATQTFLQQEFDKFLTGDDYEKPEGYVPPSAWLQKCFRFAGAGIDSGESNGFNSALFDARLAQSVEQGIENPRVPGSIPGPGTISKSMNYLVISTLDKCRKNLSPFHALPTTQ